MDKVRWVWDPAKVLGQPLRVEGNWVGRNFFIPVAWIESNANQRAFHDWLLSLWKLETQPEWVEELAKSTTRWSPESLELKDG